VSTDVGHKNQAPTSRDVYIGRPSKWGNPFVIGRDGNRQQVCEKFDRWIVTQPALMAAAKSELKGKRLICWCAPDLCHGDTLAAIAESRFPYESQGARK
jgi:hypothetical protein